MLMLIVQPVIQIQVAMAVTIQMSEIDLRRLNADSVDGNTCLLAYYGEVITTSSGNWVYQGKLGAYNLYTKNY